MSIMINLPPHLEKELMGEARREGIAPAEQAALFLCVAGALHVGGPGTPFSAALRSFLRRNQIDPDRLSSAFDQLEDLCFKTKSHPASPPLPEVATEGLSDRARLDGFLRRWRDDAVHQPVEEESTSPTDIPSRQLPDRPRPSILGKYAYLGFSSEDHAREKQMEIDREDRKLWE